jgi:NAD(P)-dependent dehydrogenase (short-subunit alcohol dehydrogenase family)
MALLFTKLRRSSTRLTSPLAQMSTNTTPLKMAPSKYYSFHQTPQGPGDARPAALDITTDEKLTFKLNSITMLITGCYSGIGIETARALSSTGCNLFLTARNIPKARSALQSIVEPGRVELLEMDIMSLASVRNAAEKFKKQSERLDVLICNAGIMCPPTLARTEEGFESQFGVNHLAHFLLFNLLKETMLRSSTKERSSRVVMVSSSGHRNSGGLVGDCNFKKGEYAPGKAYGQSKTANVYGE